jgi:hypothetical protein
MKNRDIKIGNVTIKDLGKIKLTSSAGFAQEAEVRFIDSFHFEMSNIRGEFSASGSHVWANTEYEIFCHTYGITIEAI